MQEAEAKAAAAEEEKERSVIIYMIAFIFSNTCDKKMLSRPIV